MSIADQVRAKKRRATTISGLVVVLTFVFLLALRVVALPWAFVVGYLTYYRMIRTEKYIIWLRRFHRSEPKRFRFNMLLKRACLGLCVPITVQDSVFRTSYYAAWSRMFLVYPIVMGVGSLLYLLCAVTITVPLTMVGVGEGLAFKLGFLMALVPLGLFVYAVKKQVVRRGHVALSPRNAIEVVGSTLLRITQRKLLFNGVMIFKCPNEVWQQVVSLVISRASAVIIDVSDLTENVLWELRISLEKHRPESVLLSFGVPMDTREELPSTTLTELEKVVSSDKLSRLRVFYYPAEVPHPSFGLWFYSLSKRLTEELAVCMKNASA